MSDLEASIGQIGNPRNWRVTPFRSFLLRRKEFGRPDLPLLGVNLVHGVRRREDDDGRPAPSEDLSGYAVVYPGDIVMNPLGKPHGSVGMSKWLGITSPAYWVLRVDESEAYPPYVHHLLRARHVVREYERQGKFMPPNQFDIAFGAFQNIRVPLPPIHEQQSIAADLDSVDAALERHRVALELLLERRQSLAVSLVSGNIAASNAPETSCDA